MITYEKKLLFYLSAVLIVLISIQYILQLSHTSIFIIKNYILQCSIILLSQIFFYCLKKEYPEHQSSILRINLVTTTAVVLIFISIYPLDFPIKEIISAIVGLIILGFMLVHKEFDAHKFPGHSARKLTVIIICVCTLIGIFLRIYKLGDLPIMVDELTHLTSGKRYIGWQTYYLYSQSHSHHFTYYIDHQIFSFPYLLGKGFLCFVEYGCGYPALFSFEAN